MPWEPSTSYFGKWNDSLCYCEWCLELWHRWGVSWRGHSIRRDKSYLNNEGNWGKSFPEFFYPKDATLRDKSPKSSQQVNMVSTTGDCKNDYCVSLVMTLGSIPSQDILVKTWKATPRPGLHCVPEWWCHTQCLWTLMTFHAGHPTAGPPPAPGHLTRDCGVEGHPHP